MNRYRFHKSEGEFGHELWVWIIWVVLLFLTTAIGFVLIGYISGRSVERAYYSPLLKGMIKQIDDKCTSTPWKHREPKNVYKRKFQN